MCYFLKEKAFLNLLMSRTLGLTGSGLTVCGALGGSGASLVSFLSACSVAEILREPDAGGASGSGSGAVW